MTMEENAESTGGVRSLDPRMVRIAVAFMLILHCGLAWFARQPGILTGQDDTEYLSLAESLRHGTYRELFRVDAPLHYQYPPGYPALLALWGAVAGDQFDALVIVNIVTSAAALLVVFLALRRLQGDIVALAALGLLAIHPELIAAAGSLMSEPLYTLASLTALLLLLRPSPTPRQLAAAGAAALFAAMTRTAGITLVAALLLHWMLERRWKLVLAPAILATLVLGAWLIWGALDPEQQPGSSYIAELRALLSGTAWTGPLVERSLGAVRWYLTTGLPWNMALPTVPGTAIDNVTGLALLLGFGGAGAFLWLQRWRVATLYLLAYALLLAVWLWAVARFALPIVPLLLCAMLTGAAAAGRRLRQGVWVPLTVVLIMGVGAAPRTAALLKERTACERAGEWPPANCISPLQASYFDALRWIDANLPEDAVFLTAKTGALWYYTGRKSVSYEAATTREPQEFVPWLRRQGAGWVILSSLWIQEPSRLAPRIAANCNHLVLQAAFSPGTWLFRVAEATPAEAAATCAAAAEHIRMNEARGEWGDPP
jgi:hypothetical protein